MRHAGDLGVGQVQQVDEAERVGASPGRLRVRCGPSILSAMAGNALADDEQALLGCLPQDGRARRNQTIRRQLGWDEERYIRACAQLEQRGYVLGGQGRGTTVRRDLTAVPPEFRSACGHPGTHVTVRQAPVTIPHALCDLTGVLLTYPGRGGATVPQPGLGTGNSLGFSVEVDRATLDVTVKVRGVAGNC